MGASCSVATIKIDTYEPKTLEKIDEENEVTYCVKPKSPIRFGYRGLKKLKN